MHLTPHAPQLSGSVAGVVHAKAAPHDRNPALQRQVESAHDAFGPQACPHTPQLAPSVLLSTSQPFDGIESQSAKPGAHAHTPDTQACPAAHARPQPPQLRGSLSNSASHPVEVSPSQSPLPATQPHAPMTHVWSARHERPQAPQLCGSVAASASQPFTTLSSQSSRPSWHWPLHCPLRHSVPGHDAPHAPQWRDEVCRSIHDVPQHVSPTAQLAQPAPWSGPCVEVASACGAPSASPPSPRRR